MKRSFFLTAFIFFALLPGFLVAQVKYIDLGIFNNPAGSNKLEIRAQTILAVTNAPWSQGIFTVRFLHSYGVTLSVFSTPYGFTVQNIGINQPDGYDYYSFYFTQGNTVTWAVAPAEYVVAVLQNSGMGNGTGTFELITGVTWTIDNNANYYIELNGGSRARTFYNNSAMNVPLPVNLLSFTAQGQNDHTALLNWKTASEVNLAYYGIEHSTDAVKFNSIGKVVREAENIKGEYNFIHTQPQAGDNYYRLRIVDLDGSFKYSDIRTVVIGDKRNDFSLKPTPTTGPLALISQNLDQYPAGLRYQLTDNTGKLLQTDLIINEKTDFNLSTYAAGIYYLTVFTDQEQVKQFKVIVTHE